MSILNTVRKIGVAFGLCYERLNPLELKLLNAVAEELPLEYAGVYKKQIDLLCHIQRHWKDKEVCMYTKGQKERELLENINLPVSRDEVKLAIVMFLDSLSLHSYRASIWVINGHVSMINFSDSPKKVDSEKIIIESVDIKYNLLEENKKIILKPLDESLLSGWVKEWRDNYQVSNLKEPLSEKDRNEIIDELEIDKNMLPADYIDLITQTDGMSVDVCDVFGLLSMRDMPMDEGNYVMLGEVVNGVNVHGAFIVKHDSTGGEIFFADYENGKDDGFSSLGCSIKNAVELKLNEEHRKGS